MSLENESIKFAEWLSNNFYYDCYTDIDNDGKTWCNYNDEDLGYKDSKRYTIKDIYKSFLINTNKVNK